MDPNQEGGGEGAEGGGGEGGDPDTPEVKTMQNYYVPIYAITAVFGAIFIIGPIVVRKNINKGLIRCCIMLTAFSMWLFWVTVYIAQMNPLVGPRVRNHTLVWISHAWGDPAE